NVLFKTTDAGNSWQVISPDLNRETYETPANLGAFAASDPEKGKHRGVIYAVAPSFKEANTIWAGTDDGLIHISRDGGKAWQNVTPSQLKPWSKVSIIEASHFDAGTAYAAINSFRLDDLRAHIYRTRDFGKSWAEITKGIPDGGASNVVREDPERKGLLFAGTEASVYVSFDDGDDWQPLQLNLPHTSMRDLVIHGDDLIVGTHGRSFWILDDITPLRQLSDEIAKSEVTLFKPQAATRFRWNRNPDTPLPPEVPAGKNPPDDALDHEYPISAIFRDTPRHPLGAWALPGQYTMKLTVAGKTYEAPLTVRMDPRIQTPPADLAKQFEMETGAVAGLNQTYAAVQQVQSLRSELKDRAAKAGKKQLADAIAALDKKAAELAGATREGFFGLPPAGKQPENFSTLHQHFAGILSVADSADAAPPTQATAIYAELQAALKDLLARWEELKTKDLAGLDEQFK